MKNQTRSLKIRKKAPENAEDARISLIKAVLDKELAPIREQVLILKQNSHTTGVLLKDIFGSALMADSINASTKNKLEEFFTHMNASSTNLENYLEIAEEDLPQKVDLSVFSSTYSDGDEWEETIEADNIIENISEDDVWD